MVFVFVVFGLIVICFDIWERILRMWNIFMYDLVGYVEIIRDK